MKIDTTDRERFLAAVTAAMDMTPLFMAVRDITEDPRLDCKEMTSEEINHVMSTFKTCALRQTGSFLLQIGHLARAVDDFGSHPLTAMLIRNDCQYLLLALQPLREMVSLFDTSAANGGSGAELRARIAEASSLMEQKVLDLQSLI